ncbi:hypothetical protein HOLleu_18648 [Holothuria leucospilota]|uniref:Uncharacterized protein n=1 Tax=Holothuria leucospilota TaxID=206669 RepID=A0A9Q1H9L4_HOLLE|nr:hypothetical protein HOLleu_18648 [Holothuria leucospilota]
MSWPSSGRSGYTTPPIFGRSLLDELLFRKSLRFGQNLWLPHPIQNPSPKTAVRNNVHPPPVENSFLFLCSCQGAGSVFISAALLYLRRVCDQMTNCINKYRQEAGEFVLRLLPE